MANDSKKTIMGQTLTRLRKAHRLTQEQVADILKIKRSTYAYYERNITPTTENIIKLSILFNVSTHEIMYGEPDPYYRGFTSMGDRSNSIVFGNVPTHIGKLREDERILIGDLRLLPQNVREKFIKDLKELREKYEQ